MASQVTDGTARAKERHAAIFHSPTSFGGNIVLLSQVRARLDNKDQDEDRIRQKDEKTKENQRLRPVRVFIICVVGIVAVLTIIIDIDLTIEDGLCGTPHQNVRGCQSPKELEGCPERLFVGDSRISRNVQFRTCHDLTE